MNLSINSMSFMGGQTALQTIKKGEGAVEKIVESGVDVNVKDSMTAVDLAAKKVYDKIAERAALLSKGIGSKKAKENVKNAGKILDMVDKDGKYDAMKPYIDYFG